MAQKILEMKKAYSRSSGNSYKRSINVETLPNSDSDIVLIPECSLIDVAWDEGIEFYVTIYAIPISFQGNIESIDFTKAKWELWDKKKYIRPTASAIYAKNTTIDNLEFTVAVT